MIFESHAHYDDKSFDPDREALFKEFERNQIGCIINIASNLESSRKSIEIAKKYPFIYTSVGVHPHDVADMKEKHLEYLIHFAAYEKVVAIGEIGLDYYYQHSPKSVQKLWFREQLKIAKELELPVVIHSREAAKDCYDILSSAELSDKKGVIHCYSGSKEMALDYVKAGFYIGIGGVVTFKNAKKLIEVVEAIPLTNILIETDAPYLAPEPYRGKRNNSLYLKPIIEKIAFVKGVSAAEVEEITYQNGKRCFQV